MRVVKSLLLLRDGYEADFCVAMRVNGSPRTSAAVRHILLLLPDVSASGRLSLNCRFIMQLCI